MRILRQRSLRGTLIALFMLISFVALFISSASFVFTDLVYFRRSAVEDLGTLARIVGANSASALNFDDERFAESALSSLSAKPSVLAAALYTKEGDLLASYRRSDRLDEVVPRQPEPDGHVIRDDELVLFQPVLEEEQRLGTIYLRSDLQLDERLVSYAGIGLAILLAASLVAWLLSFRLQKVVSQPILDLAWTARVVSTEKDYSVRAPTRHEGEIGLLSEQFNDMLAEIESRTAALARSKEELETVLEETVDIDRIARTANSTLDISQVLEAVMVALQKVFPFDGVAAALVDEDGDHLTFEHRMVIGPGLVAESVDRNNKIRVPMDEVRSALVSVLQRGRPFFLPEITSDTVAAMSPTDRLLFHDFNPRSLLICPLEVQGGAVGVILFTNSRQTLELEREDVETVQRYVTPLATALQNASLFEDAKRASAAAEDANQTKSIFLANMSHELRTPLNAIIGYSEMLREEAEDDGNESYLPDLGKILSSARHLLELINGVLDLAKIESGKMELHLEEFDASELLRGVEGTVQPLVRKHANQLELRGLDALGSMHSDVTKLRQMLFNLLSNASKFTKSGVIRLEAGRKTEAGADWLHFRVVDSGIGMTEEQLSRVFEEFSQADSSVSREYGGTGLGLPITKKFCEMLGGSITATSEPGAGSTFEIRLPARAPSLAAPEAIAGEEGAATVLVIDDDAAARDLIGRYLSRDGYRVLMAVDGEQGLRLAREKRPDVITLDVVMPHVDGWTVLQQLKADPELAPIPVVLVTMTDDRSLGFALGASEYLSKPIDRRQLAAVLQRYQGSDPSAPALVVDDEPNAREMLRRPLERAGWPVIEAENGREALARLAEATPRLILLDLMMPVMDGFEFVAELRRNPAWNSIPVLVITAMTISADDRARLEGGVSRIIQKGSFGRDELLREIRTLAESRSQSA